MLFTHVLAAAVWTGGHLVLAITVLPSVLRDKDLDRLVQFENGYERIGIPALILQVITGIWLAYRLIPSVGMWFSFGDPLSITIFTKLALLLLTVLFALDARLRIIPNLNENNLKSLAYHIIPVTIISVIFVFMGVSFKAGLIF